MFGVTEEHRIDVESRGIWKEDFRFTCSCGEQGTWRIDEYNAKKDGDKHVTA